ncbi:sensor histidine kinase [Streptomyces litchfieldiae]|uniref:histidine kinase n=1 Tax=Streptomyces litchfieldiae TaxID=3075543 RepID=A0ABU2MJ97_9ACTN|nr:sensor histidine kinase [Streptomyces sp. DSM 44938]MDT0341551.1 sensor histidine kinase [Streptomyces sp. DSM 44938]
MRKMLRRWLRMATGLALGVPTAAMDLGALALAALARRPGSAVALRTAGLERARVARFLGGDPPAPAPVPPRAAVLGYLAVRWLLGALGALVLLSVLIGAAYFSILLWLWFVVEHWLANMLAGIGGLFLLFLSAYAVQAVAALETTLVRHFFGPSRRDALERRIEELAVSRAGVVQAVHDERRRIERDLHDGVQQRLVALGMLLGRARRRGDGDGDLLTQAHQQARQALSELREVAWRVYPTVLDEAGLRAALEAVAERCPLPVRLDYRLPAEPDPAVAAVAYFVVSEAVTNAVKHSGARTVSVRLAPGDEALTLTVTDDGAGGADPTGGGLLGLARRAAALDGTLRVDSPPGGPTTITAELPCA